MVISIREIRQHLAEEEQQQAAKASHQALTALPIAGADITTGNTGADKTAGLMHFVQWLKS